ncbi:DUF4855 domain-containing protein [Paenibacillus sp. DMB20]|uniref:DUF4855 domain-containing protein n=1 Tax=Paenibacillus sp. DMB20 TaxID=1642570 RepID=UPI00069A9BDD|nr:DUF4855 domain-containing protein [Paenibacillus sp. DMB20]
MKFKQKWAVLVMIMSLLLTLVPAVQAKEADPPAQTEEQPLPDKMVDIDPAVQPQELSSVLEAGGVVPAVYEPNPGQRNLALGLDYEWSQGPEASHPDDSKKLTDGIYGGLDISDPAWVGHVNKMTREVIFDLGEPKSISNIKARFLQDWPTKSLVPLTVSMYVSDDKENWGTLSHNATQLLWGDGPPRQEIFEWDGSRDGIRSGNLDAEMAYARYVKVTFTMHTRAWTFIDEIEITGADGKLEGAVTVPAEQPAFLEPGEATAGIRNLGLLYNGHYPNDKGTWMKDRIIPNISYVDQAGEPKDILFDGVVYLGLDSPNSRAFDGNANPSAGARLEDWNWYLDKTFADTGDMHQLNEATKEVGAKLGQPDFKEKVVLMIPNPGEFLSDFGVINGEALSFSASDVGEEKAFANREKAIQWWVNEVLQKWGAKNYSHLELVGMYWLEEQISTSEKGPDLVLSTSRMVHENNLKFFWIPHFLAYKGYMWKDVGIDAVAFQPNYFFEEMGYDRLADAANLAKQYGMSIELEFDDRMLTDAVFRERYIDYLNSGVETGLMQNGFRAYYQGNDAVRNTAVSTDPATRILYDWLYQFVKGTYQINSGAPPEAVVKMNGQTLQSGAVVPDTEPIQFTWEVKDDDGSGLVQVSATFNGKPYTAGTAIDLAGKPGKHELVITVVAGKSQKTAYIIEASTNADGLKAWVNRFAEELQITNAEAVRSLNNYLEMMKRYEGVDETQALGYLKGFNAKLDQLKKDQTIKDGAYGTLKEGVYYLIGNAAANKPVEASSVEGGNSNYAPQKSGGWIPCFKMGERLYQ